MNPKVVVITGATRGCGRALAERLVHDGHTVVGCGRSRALIQAATAQFPPPHRFDTVDVTDDAAVAAWAKEISRTVGAPDLLVNNAALINHNAPLWNVPASEFDAVVRVNLIGVANVIRQFIPAMLPRSRGVIVNISSGWGRSVDAEVAPYCATKWAIEGLSQALALEVPAGMAVVALNPGIIDTDMLRSCFGSAAGHYPGPKAWADRAAPFLLGLDAGHNGRSMTVPG